MVVATRDEILLVAVEQFTQGTFTVRLTPTDFAIPTDNQDVTRGAIAGTASGRIFLGSSQVLCILGKSGCCCCVCAFD